MSEDVRSEVSSTAPATGPERRASRSLRGRRPTPGRRGRGLPSAYWWLWIGTFVNRAGSFVAPFLVLYLTQDARLSPAEAGWIVTGWGLGSFASQFVGGVAGDRFGRRITMVTSMVGTSCALLLLGAAATPRALFAAAVATGLAGDLYRPAAAAMVADLVAPEDRPRAYGLLFWAVNLGFATATAAAGIVAEIGYELLFRIDAATTMLFAGVLLSRIPETRPASQPETVVQASRGLLHAVRDRLLVIVALLLAGYAALYFQTSTTLPLQMTAQGLSESDFGRVLALNGVVIVLVQPLVVGWLGRRAPSDVLTVGFGLVGLGMAATGLMSTVAGFAATVVVWTLGEIAVSIMAPTLIADIAPAHMQSRYQAWYGLAFGGAAVVVPAAATRAWSVNPAALWWGCAALGALLVLVQSAASGRIRQRLDPGPRVVTMRTTAASES